MKKGMILFVILTLLPLVSSVEYACSNGTSIQSSSEEISEGNLKSIFSLPIGICGASENSYGNWIESNIFIDSNLVYLSAPNISEGTELISENKSISYSLIQNNNQAILKVGTSTENLEIGDCSEIGGNAVMIKSISSNGQVEVLVAAEKIILNTKTNSSKIIEFDSKKYGVQLLSGSAIHSLIRLNRCTSGEIYEKSPNLVINSTNSTTPSNSTNSTLNQTPQNNTLPATNSTTPSNSTNSTLKADGESCSSNEMCSTNYCRDEICSKKGFFRKILKWFGDLFQ